MFGNADAKVISAQNLNALVPKLGIFRRGHNVIIEWKGFGGICEDFGAKSRQMFLRIL